MNDSQFNENVRQYEYARTSSLIDSSGKLTEIGEYISQHGIENAIVGLSGGIDSTLVLYMLASVAKRNPNLKVHGVCYHFPGIYQNFDFGFMEKLKNDPKLADVKLSLKVCGMPPSLNSIEPTPELLAQTSYAYRYHALFELAQSLPNAIVFGTTNLDEFAFSGWFGKHSDMMVDVQPIIDLHKFEVNKWAAWVDVPDSFITAVPKGDLLDGSSDEDNFGCTYSQLAYISWAMCQPTVSVSFVRYCMERFPRLMALNKKNQHKYQGQGFNPVMLTDPSRFFYYDARS